MNFSSPLYNPGATTGLALRPGGTVLTDRALSVCGFPPRAQLLDVGCGLGSTVQHLMRGTDFRITGLDPSAALLEGARNRARELSLVKGRAEALPFPDRSQDGLLCECVLSLLDDPQRALGEFSRVLRPGGCLILSDLYERSGNPQTNQRAMDSSLHDHGFTTLLWEDHTPLLREMAAQLILAGASPADYCSPGLIRPGYYLLAARLQTT